MQYFSRSISRHNNALCMEMHACSQKNIPFSFRALLLEELTILNKKNAENIAE